MDDQFNLHDFSDELKMFKYIATIKEVSTGELSEIRFITGVPISHKDNLQFSDELARGILRLSLQEKYGEGLYTIESLSKLDSIVDIIVEPICPN